LAVVFAEFAVLFAELAVALALLAVPLAVFEVSIARFESWTAVLARPRANLASFAVLAPIEGTAQARASRTAKITTSARLVVSLSRSFPSTCAATIGGRRHRVS
jgi:hypothetical protein